MALSGSSMLSRRDLINGTIGVGVALAIEGARTAQAQLNTRKRTIVDAQVHLWKAESPDWPWVPGRKPQLPEPFTIEKLVPLMDDRVSIASWWCRRRGQATVTTTGSRRRDAIRSALP